MPPAIHDVHAVPALPASASTPLAKLAPRPLGPKLRGKTEITITHEEDVQLDRRLTPRAREVYTRLKKYAGRKDAGFVCAWPSINTLAKDCGMARRHVCRSLRTLRAAGYISWVKREDQDGDYTSNLYFFHRPTLEAGDRRGRGWGADTFTEGFLAFWVAYPERKRSRKTGAKRKAWAEWKALNPDEALQRLILEKVRRYADHWRTFGEGNGRYLLTPANWLREQRWEDDLPLPRNEHEADEWERADTEGGVPKADPTGVPKTDPTVFPRGTRNPPQGTSTDGNLQKMVSATADSLGETSEGEGFSPVSDPLLDKSPAAAPAMPSTAPAPVSASAATAIEDDPAVLALDPEMRKLYDRWMTPSPCQECGQAPAKRGSVYCFSCSREIEG